MTPHNSGHQQQPLMPLKVSCDMGGSTACVVSQELGKSLNIKVAPTFFLYKNSQKVAEMTGAKVDKLKQLIDMHMPGDADAE